MQTHWALAPRFAPLSFPVVCCSKSIFKENQLHQGEKERGARKGARGGERGFLFPSV